MLGVSHSFPLKWLWKVPLIWKGTDLELSCHFICFSDLPCQITWFLWVSWTPRRANEAFWMNLWGFMAYMYRSLGTQLLLMWWVCGSLWPLFWQSENDSILCSRHWLKRLFQRTFADSLQFLLLVDLLGPSSISGTPRGFLHKRPALVAAKRGENVPENGPLERGVGCEPFGCGVDWLCLL